MRLIICGVIYFWVSIYTYSQDLPVEVIARVNCPLQNGVYINFNQFTDNKPVPFFNIASEGDISSFKSISETLSQKKITYFNNLGEAVSVNTSNLWGFCYNCNVYIYVGEFFLLIPKLETLSRIPESVPDKWYSERVENPDFNSLDTDNSYQAIDNIDLFVDLRTGVTQRFTPENLLLLISLDSTLYNEYNSLSTRKQKKRKLHYLNSFNQRNPLNLHKQH
jgi:hypothetical protein